MFHEQRSESLAIEYFQSGIQRYAETEYEASRRDLTIALELNPRLVLAYCYLSMIYQEWGEYSLSIAICQEGLKYDSQSAFLRFCLANAFEKSERWIEALDEFNHFYQLQPENTEVVYSMACIHERLGDNEEARRLFKVLQDLDTKDERAFYHLALLSLQVGNDNEAFTFLRKVVQLNPQFWQGWWKLGILYSKKGKIQKAIDAYERVVELNHDFPEVYYNLGINYRLVCSFSQAIFSFKTVLKMTPGDLDARYNLAVCFLDVEQYASCIEVLTAVILEDLNHEPAHYRLAQAFALSGDEERYEKEISFLKRKNSLFADKLIKGAWRD